MSIQDAYNEWSEIYDSNTNLTRDLDKTVTREMLAEKHFDSVLEIGCGTGKNTVFLAQIADKVLAFDFSEGMVQQARKKVQADNVRFEMADITQPWQCADSSFDLVTCSLVLEHIQDLSHIFSEAARTLKPGGWFFVNELHPFKQYSGTKARFERGTEIVELEVFIHHISDFTNAAKDHGFKLVVFNEGWHPADEKTKPPRLATFLFEKCL